MSGMDGRWLALAVPLAAAAVAAVGPRGSGRGSRVGIVEVRPLSDILDQLHALERLYRSLHWQASGPNSYGDHLLYERMYKALPGEIDQLGERIVGLSGRPDQVSAVNLETRSAKLLLKWADAIPTGLARATFAEKDLIALIAASMGTTDPGTENLLQSIADTHQGHLYLLGRRSASAGSRSRRGSRCGCGKKGSACGCGSSAREVPDPATMTAGEINRELDRIVEVRDQIGDELIAAGRGYEKSSETLAKTDPLALRFQAIGKRAGDLHAEIEARYGPRAPVRLPLKGFGPRKKKGSAAGRPLEVGDRVVYSADWVRNTGQVASNDPAIHSAGVIEGFGDLGSSIRFASVRWPDGVRKVNENNLAREYSVGATEISRTTVTGGKGYYDAAVRAKGSQVRKKPVPWATVSEGEVTLLGGEPSLVSDGALVAVLLDQTTGRHDPGQVARDVVQASGDDLFRLTSPDFAVEVDGLSRSGRARLLASGEVVRRGLHRAQMVKLQPIRNPRDIVNYVEAAAIGPYESLLVIFVNRRMVPRGMRILSRGSDAFTIVDPRQVLRSALAADAHAIILVHNHPSGDPTPSQQDRDVTRRVAAAARVVGISLLDHVVVAAGGQFVSLADQGDVPQYGDAGAAWTSSA